MAGTVDYVRDTLVKSYGLIKERGQGIFMALLKLGAMQMLVAAVMLILIGAVALFLLGASVIDALRAGALPQSFLSNTAVTLLVVVPVLVIGVLLTSAIKSVGFNVIENISGRKPTDLLGQARKNFWPIVKLEVVVWGITLLLVSPILLSMLAGGLAGMAAFCAFMAVSGLACALFWFFIQFSTLEVVLRGKRPVDALKASIALVKGNLLGVLLIDVLLAAAAMALSAATSIVQTLLRLVLQIFSAGGAAGTAVGAAIYVLGIAAVSIAIGAIVQTLTLPVIYNFWKGRKG